MTPQEISYALTKQTVDMARRGVVIRTAYGELVVEPGPMANSIAQHVTKLLERELRKQERAALKAGA